MNNTAKKLSFEQTKKDTQTDPQLLDVSIELLKTNSQRQKKNVEKGLKIERKCLLAKQN